MLPGMIALGCAAMLIAPPKWQWFAAVTLAGGALWLGTFLFPTPADPGTLSWWQLVPGAFAIGAANAAVGALVAWPIRYALTKVVVTLWRRSRSDARSESQVAA